MEYRSLGRTGLRVSVCGLGGGGESRLGLRKGGTEEQAVDVVRRALDLGVTFVDTAPGYGTEEVIGAGLRGRRDGVVVSSKVLARRGDGSPARRADLRDGLAASLRRLGTDVLDVYHLHRVRPEDYDHVADELVPELLALRDEGLVRALGITESTGTDGRHSMLARALADDCWDVVMTGFTFFNQSAREVLLPVTTAHGVGVEIMASARSVFSDRRQLADRVAGLVADGRVDGDLVDAADPLGFLLASGEVGSVTEASYRFAAHEPGVHVVLTGTGDPVHLEQNVRSLSAGPLPPDVRERLVALFGHLALAVEAPWRTSAHPIPARTGARP